MTLNTTYIHWANQLVKICRGKINCSWIFLAHFLFLAPWQFNQLFTSFPWSPSHIAVKKKHTRASKQPLSIFTLKSGGVISFSHFLSFQWHNQTIKLNLFYSVNKKTREKAMNAYIISAGMAISSINVFLFFSLLFLLFVSSDAHENGGQRRSTWVRK